MKTTDKQIIANRGNADKSTGPVTPSGKAIASRNALKHGLLAKEIVINAGEGAESQEEFDAVLLDLKDQLDPQGALEEMLVEKIAAAYWRLRRAHRFEVGLIRTTLDNITDKYYQKTSSYSDTPIHKTDRQIDADIQQAKEIIEEWQRDSAHFTKLRQSGKDLKEIYDYEMNWESLYEEADEIEVELSDDSPARICESLKNAGWTDDKIWQLHLKICDDAISVQQQDIRDLNAEKENNKLALQVKKKLGSIPESHELDRLLKYEGSIEKQFYKAINQLERLQRIRKGDNVPAPVNIDLNIDKENGSG